MPLTTTTHLSPVMLRVMEVPLEGTCHSPHTAHSAVGHMMAVSGSHATSRSPDVHTRFTLAMLARLSGCLRSGSRFSHLSSGDSRFIVCNAQCPF